MRVPTQSEVSDWIDEARSLLNKIEANSAEVIQLAKEGTRNGYPTSSMGGDGRGGGNQEMFDKDGHSLGFGPASSDPTGEIAATIDQPRTDPIRSDVVKAVSHLRSALPHLRAADGLVQKNLQLPQPERRREVTIITCRNCGALLDQTTGKYVPDCEACYRYERRTGEKRPTQLWNKTRRRRAS